MQKMHYRCRKVKAANQKAEAANIAAAHAAAQAADANREAIAASTRLAESMLDHIDWAFSPEARALDPAVDRVISAMYGDTPRWHPETVPPRGEFQLMPRE